MVTWLAGNGVPPHVCDRLLNHITGSIQGVAAVYQRQEFLAETKEALELWAGMKAFTPSMGHTLILAQKGLLDESIPGQECRL
jgi:hypothetical protein